MEITDNSCSFSKCLSIAGFDSSGGAGLQADIKTFSAWGCYGMTVLTALPIQNTMGVRNCYTIPTSSIQEQLEAIFDDIRPDSIKIGMLFSKNIIRLVSKFIQCRAETIPIVTDPVMYAKSGNRLLEEDAVDALKNEIFPLSTVITPNIPEALLLTGLKESTEKHHIMESLIGITSCSVLLKGGHSNSDECDDWLYYHKKKNISVLHGKRVQTKNTHGTGCTMSAAIASGLALGFDIPTSCEKAKQYVYNAIIQAQKNPIGKGAGPVHHFYNIWPNLTM
ncbi:MULTISPECIES: bifunctional hydroxymethylpyrimidine kinase/phosphomethylpyrimidine kinase [Candidatus Ichthyocystis]|uniref:bifunctional hydroxymethylpyrimidine kinase/phosphomethylpyrimidine kinase n=1 Tax=Candidatus Ichthyocystis TaxID=2929841 RepID=UPI000A7E3F6F|nr:MULTISPECIES: bifunctional hydroxymethylpyrimidine kinase/phosphomethylpyrimidine kinase [Ichthyocystis]